MITKFDDIKISEPETDDLEGWVVVQGKPTMKTQVLHTNNEKI